MPYPIVLQHLWNLLGLRINGREPGALLSVLEEDDGWQLARDGGSADVVELGQLGDLLEVHTVELELVVAILERVFRPDLFRLAIYGSLTNMHVSAQST
jgi:hypothetical protein